MGRILNQRITGRHCLTGGLALALVILLSLIAGSALAATVEEDETYHLKSGDVLEDDLIVFAQTITIDGKIEGDLVAFGQTIIVNGEVTEDVIAAGAEVIINGKVGDDARLAGMHVMIEGEVGDDVVAAGGPAIPGTGPVSIPIGGTTIQGGVGSGNGATIGGDAYYAGGFVTLAGVYKGDLAASAELIFFDANVQGNVDFDAGSISFGDSTFVTGNLSYSTERVTGTPEVEGEITKTLSTDSPQPDSQKESHPVRGFGWWLVRTLLIIIGIGIVGALAVVFMPQCLNRPVVLLRQKTASAFLYGLLAAVVAIPLSMALTFLAWLFFGWFWGGVAAFTFLFGLLVLIWTFSPLVPGIWIGQTILNMFGAQRGQIWAPFIGAALIITVVRVIGQIPCAGALAGVVIYLAMFSLSVGSTILAMTSSPTEAQISVAVEEIVEAAGTNDVGDSNEGANEDDKQHNNGDTAS